MNSYAVAPLLTTILIASMGIFVYTRDKTSKLNITFSLFCLSMTIWLLSFALMYANGDKVTALWWARTGFVGITFIPSTMYHFVSTFLQLQQRKIIISLYLLSLLGLTISRTSLVYQGVWNGFWGYYPIAGPLYPIFPLIFSICFVGGVLRLYFALHEESRPLRRRQIKCVMFAFICGTPGVVDYIVKYQVNIYPFGYLAALSLISLVAYAIVQHRLMEIEVIIKRTVVFAGIVISVVAAVSLMAFVSQDALTHYIEIPRAWSNVMAAVIIAAAYERIRNWLVNVTDRYLFQKKYDYKVLLKKFTNEVMIVLDIKQLVEMTVRTLAETVKLEGCSLLLRDKETRTYQLAAARGTKMQASSLSEQDPLVVHLCQTHEPISQDGELGKVRFPGEIENRLAQLRARLVLPLHLHKDLIGILSLGNKKSDEEFTKDDLDILLPLAKTLAISIQNALSFEQLVRVNEQLKVATERLVRQERLAAVGQLAAGMAHEIKNPMSAIKTFAQYLPEKYADPEFREKFFRIVQSEIDRISGIVHQLSDFAKPAPPRLQLVCCVDLLEDALSLLSGQCLKQDVHVSKSFDANSAIVRADPQQLKQVILNLLLNGLEAMAKGGVLEVSTRVQDQELILKIHDTGCGIDPLHQQSIWDPFFTTKERGMGLGLAIVKGIVERHGGRISLSSVPGEGTSVEIWLGIGK